MTNENTQITVDPIFVLYTVSDINQCIYINIVDVKNGEHYFWFKYNYRNRMINNRNEL